MGWNYSKRKVVKVFFVGGSRWEVRRNLGGREEIDGIELDLI